MSAWDKEISSNSGEGKQAETQGSVIGQEKMNFTQIPTLGAL